MQIFQTANIYQFRNLLKYTTKKITQVSSIWGYVAIAFNRVDIERLKLVGPDRLCAEWILKNGGKIGIVGFPNHLLMDYNLLPPESQKFQLKIIDGTASSVMKIGLDHFKGCKHIDTVIFHECKHLEEDGLDGLIHLKDTLEYLQVSGCYNLTAPGLNVIGELKNLQKLVVFDMKYVKNIETVLNNLKKQLPRCHIQTERVVKP